MTETTQQRASKGKIPCAIVLEDNPIGDDSRFNFESFPEEGISEGYSTYSYREMGGNRLSQPGYAAYQGGDWKPFNLKLQLVAGLSLPVGKSPTDVTEQDLEQILIAMESKANWLVALQFPLERNTGVTQAERVLGVQRGTSAQTANQVDAVANLPRNDPPIILVVLGSWKTIRGYVTSADWTWGPNFHPVSARPMAATVNLSIKPQMAVIPTFKTIRGQPGQMGFTTEFVIDRGENPAKTADDQRTADNAEAVAQLVSTGLGTVAGAAVVGAR
jgi:hypothetical protein